MAESEALVCELLGGSAGLLETAGLQKSIFQQEIWANAHKTAKAYSSSCSQIAFVCFQAFHRNSLLKCTALPKIAKKNNKTPYCLSSGSFRVIDVDMTKKSVTSACCDRRHIHAYCDCFHARLANSRQITTLGWQCNVCNKDLDYCIFYSFSRKAKYCRNI